jgi:hypothetical protein
MTPEAGRRAGPGADAVGQFLDTLEHRERRLIDAVRALIAAAAPAATEQVKWNAPRHAACIDDCIETDVDAGVPW